MLFQYTDGVTEATDAALELFGEERMIDALNQFPESGPEETIHHMHAAINAFVKEATQFDDITMLCVRYNGEGEEDSLYRSVLTVPADTDRLDEVTEFLERELEQIGGLGIHLVRKLMDEVHYEYQGAKNMLTIRRYL